MSQTRTLRDKKRQLGQFLTPTSIAERLANLPLTRDTRVLEPSFGEGAFLLPLIEQFLPLYDGPISVRLDQILTCNLYGVEIDPELHAQCLEKIRDRWGYCPSGHNLLLGDFFQAEFVHPFDIIIGNPPFGGTIAPELQDKLDKQFGWRNGLKIKKETYSFFIVKCLDLLKADGHLRFICSDTFLTINTMQGLRRLLLDSGAPKVTRLEVFSEETKYAMVVLDLAKTGPSSTLFLDGKSVLREQIALTGNHSWQITDAYAPYFAGPKLGDFIVATSGMTIGNNSLFVREIKDGRFIEPFEFKFFDEPLTLENEVNRARLGFLSPQKRVQIIDQACRGAARRNVRVTKRPTPLEIVLPHPDYRPYNKADSTIVYAPPAHAIYWKDDGDAALTFKKNGNWYLHGVGGQKFFGHAGLTWQLISQTLNARYLPSGCILDSGAPCAFLREGIDPDELYFLLGWTFSPLCLALLKDVINHTKNIQGKDFERLPYPFWASAVAKQEIIGRVKKMVEEALAGRVFRRTDTEILAVGGLFTDSSRG
ncbi:MAG: Eco57I restriction-modification methylase domain-containing protein [Janthinobacterium lividum]